WLFAGSLRAGQRAAAVMTLIQSTKLNGHDPLAYLGDILQRLPTQPNHRIHELLPHRWRPAEQKHPQKELGPQGGLGQGVFTGWIQIFLLSGRTGEGILISWKSTVRLFI